LVAARNKCGRVAFSFLDMDRHGAAPGWLIIPGEQSHLVDVRLFCTSRETGRRQPEAAISIFWRVAGQGRAQELPPREVRHGGRCRTSTYRRHRAKSHHV
jgi:hypothetical protein